MSSGFFTARSSRAWLMVVPAAGLMLLPQPGLADEKRPFNLKGTYVEGCSCMAPCPCEMIGLRKGCEGVGALSLTSGSYMGTNLAGTKIAYAVAPGNWIRLYVDAPKPAQKKAATELSKAIFKPWGKLEEVKYAPIQFTGSGGWYKVSVDKDAKLKLATKPVLGKDKKTPISHENVSNTLTSTFLQGQVVSGSFKDGSHEFMLKGGNSYFYPVRKHGRV